MRSIYLVFTLAFLVSLNACKKQDEIKVQPSPLRNGDFEQQAYGWYGGYRGAGQPISYNWEDNNPNEYIYAITDEAASSPEHSLKISCKKIVDENAYFFWSQNYIPTDNIPVGAKLTLKAKIKTVLKGNGISMTMRGDKGNHYGIFFPSTEGKTLITGTQDFTEYSLILDAYPGEIDNLQVFFIYLPGTTGVAYLDDVSLTID